MRTIRSILALSFLASGAFFACHSPAEDAESSGAAHTAGEIVWENDPHLWADVDRTAFDGAWPLEKAAAVDHVATVRIQAWIDRYDAIVREMVAANGRALVAPRPQARVLVAPSVNANVRAVPVCIAVAPSPVSPTPARVEMLSVMLRPRSVFNTNLLFKGNCAKARNFSPESGLGWFNGLGGLEVRPGEAAIEIIGQSPDPVVARAEKVAINATAPFVTVNAGLVTSLSEKATAAVIAHELAHYYRSHLGVSVADRYDFFFDRDAPVASRPTPVADQKQYWQDYARFKFPRFTIEGQHYHPRVAASLVRWFSKMPVGGAHVCAPAKKAFTEIDASIRTELLDGSDRELSPQARAAYLGFEPKMKACIDALEIGDGAASAGTIDAGSAVPRASLLEWTDDALEGAAVAADVAAARTGKDLVAALEAAGKKLDAEAPAFLKRLADNHVGYYTVEQEADDLALELGTRIGLKPTEVMNGFVELMAATEVEAGKKEFAAKHGMSAAQCKDLVARKFRSASGEVHVPFGKLEDPHHAWCYRLFNLQREMSAHAYTVASPSFPDAMPAWNDVQIGTAKLLSPAPPPPSPDGGVTTDGGTEPGQTEPAPEESGEGEVTGEEDPGASEELTKAEEAPKKKATSESGGCSASSGTSHGDALGALGLALAAGMIARRRRR